MDITPEGRSVRRVLAVAVMVSIRKSRIESIGKVVGVEGIHVNAGGEVDVW
jgi:hypothetical protein